MVSEGLSIIGADVWQNAGLTGQGIKIGILDIGLRNAVNWFKNQVNYNKQTLVLGRHDSHIAGFHRDKNLCFFIQF